MTRVRCFRFGHDWTGWSPYIPARTPMQPFMEMSAPIEPLKLEAYRYRQCRECGEIEKEPY